MHTDGLMHGLDFFVYAAFSVTLVALPFLLVNWFIYIKRIYNRGLEWRKVPFPTKSVLGFAVPILVAFPAAEISKSIGQDEVLNELRNLPYECPVLVEGLSRIPSK